jgi:replicative DNA helicase
MESVMDTYLAETSVLGSILLESSLFAELEIDSNYFIETSHQIIFEAMKNLHDQKKVIDTVTLTTALDKNLDLAGGVSYLVELVESVPSTRTMKHYEEILKEAYQVRKAKRAVERFLGESSLHSLDQLLEELRKYSTLHSSDSEESMYNDLVQITRELTNPSENSLGFMTGLAPLDDLTGGLQRGDLIILAARPSVGKTAVALNLAAGHCKHSGSSQIFSLEMGGKQLLRRMISAEAHVHSNKWLDPKNRFAQKDYDNLLRAIGEIANWKLEISCMKRTIREIRAEVRNYMQAHPDDEHLILIDYLQLITPGTFRNDRRDLELGEITRELKLLAMEFNIPVVLLSQLSRGVDSRQDKRPLMSDLRDSGNIEQDADLIAFLYRDDYYNRDSNGNNELEVIISKHRNGPTGTVELEFLREFGSVRAGAQ